MSAGRRGRAIAFGLTAIACAVAAAALAGGYRSSIAASFGELRPVVVARVELAGGRPIGPAELSRLLELRRVPARFVPPDTLARLEGALGQAPSAPISAGSYVQATALRPPRPKRHDPLLGAGRRPVEIAVSGAGALLAGGSSPQGHRVDVIVTTEPASGGRGRTYVAAAGVELLALQRGGAGAGGAGSEPSAAWSATLALTRGQALDLIEAENFARQVRLLPRAGVG